MTLRLMTTDDLEACFNMTQRLKWPHRRQDWQLVQRLGEGVVTEEQGKLTGCAILWRWGERAATIGLVIVDNQRQGRGLGRQLMLALLEKVPDYHLRLHATEQGKRLYERLGFVSCGTVRQHQTSTLARVPASVIPAGLQLRRALTTDHARLVELDQQAHGMLRPDLYHHLIGDAQTIILDDMRQNIHGFASLRRFGHGWVIGPIIAATLPVAQALVATLMQGLSGEFIRIDTDGALPLAPWLSTLGLELVDAPTTMVRGRPWTSQGMQTFGLMSMAMA
nr:GNAT family N-acetyltransferase [Mixta mediterraneensis]